MDPMTIMLLSQLVPSVIAGGKAISQGIKANEFSKTQRPEQKVPEAITQMVNQARYLSGMRELPGQNIMEGRLGENTAKGISELRNVSANPADIASNVARMYGSNVRGLQDINIAAGNQWMNNQGILSNALGRLGVEQQKVFDVNEMQPYLAAKAAESALREGAFRNLSNVGTNIASAGTGYANYQTQQDLLDRILGKVNTGTSNNNNGGTNPDATMTGALNAGNLSGYGQNKDYANPEIMEALRGVLLGKAGSGSFETGGFAD